MIENSKDPNNDLKKDLESSSNSELEINQSDSPGILEDENVDLVPLSEDPQKNRFLVKIGFVWIIFALVGFIACLMLIYNMKTSK